MTLTNGTDGTDTAPPMNIDECRSATQSSRICNFDGSVAELPSDVLASGSNVQDLIKTYNYR
jgi:hypothetical protein